MSRNREPSAQYWKRQARRYDRATLLLNRRFREMAQRAAQDVKGAEAVLEIAAGTGLITEVAAPHARRYVATDLSAAMLELLQRRLDRLSCLETQIADVMSLEFSDDSFDVVVAGNLLHLLPDVSRALSEVRRVLHPNGLLVAPTFCHGENLLSTGISRLLGLTGFPLERRLTGAELEALISASGFQVRDAAWYPGLLPIRYVVANLDSR